MVGSSPPGICKWLWLAPRAERLPAGQLQSVEVPASACQLKDLFFASTTNLTKGPGVLSSEYAIGSNLHLGGNNKEEEEEEGNDVA